MASTNRDEISRLELLHAAHPDGLVFPHLADAYRRAGRYAQAESVLNAGLRHHADYSSAHVVLGRLRLDQGKRHEAKNAFERVLQLDSQNHVALEFLGRLAEEEGRYREALSFFKRLAALKPNEALRDQIGELEQRIEDRRRTPVSAGDGASESAGGNGGPESDEEGIAVEELGAGTEPEPEVEAERTSLAGTAEPVERRDEDADFPEPGEVVTETMAELYLSQGLYDRARAVYQRLHRRDPTNTRLKAKLDDATARAAAGTEVEAEPRPPGSTEVAAAPDEKPASSPAPAQASIRAYLTGVMDWTPEARDTPGDADIPGHEDALAPEPWAEQEPEPGLESPERPARPESFESFESPEGPEDHESDDDVWEPWAEALVTEAEEREEPEAPPEPAPWELRPRSGESASEPVTWAPAPGPEPATAEPEPRTAEPEPEQAESEPEQAKPEPQQVGPKVRAEPAAARRDSARSSPAPTPRDLGLVEDDLEGIDPEAQALISLTDLLVGLLEFRDPFFRGGSSLTRLLAMNVGRELRLEPATRVHLALAAVLRDLGRLALGGRLVKTPKSEWTPDIRRKIERHVDLALHLLDGIDLPRPVIEAVRHHHERWDGDGYPDGLSGSDIPLLARIVAVVDSFAAMVSPRPYRLPRKVPDAIRELEEAAGAQYDSVVVDALLRVLEGGEQPRTGFVQRHRILLVDPDQPGGRVTAAKLCTAGYLAEVAADPDGARERLRRVPVAGVVISAGLGGEVADELIRDLRLDPLFASMPIVAVDAETVGLRVRLLEGGADVCFPPEVSHAELQGTLGALVRRTVKSREVRPGGQDEEAPWLALQGDIQDFPLAWLLQVMKYDSRTASVGIRTITQRGAIYIEQGDVVHAQIRNGERGETALKEMLQWSEGRFTVQPDARSSERSIDSSIMHLLLSQAIEEDHAAAGIFGAVSNEG